MVVLFSFFNINKNALVKSDTFTKCCDIVILPTIDAHISNGKISGAWILLNLKWIVWGVSVSFRKLKR